METKMAKIAFLGLGAMGARMAARLLAAGHDLTVWNRTEGRAADMLAQGARWMPTPRAAADGQDIVFSMLRDDDAATEVWLGRTALDGLAEGAVGVECSTLSLPGIQRLAGAFAAAGRSFIDAPLAGSRPQAEAGSLIFLAGGEAADIEGVRPVLLAMGGALHHAGPTGAGCLAKLTVNALFGPTGRGGRTHRADPQGRLRPCPHSCRLCRNARGVAGAEACRPSHAGRRLPGCFSDRPCRQGFRDARAQRRRSRRGHARSR
ncbi:NAD(P)-dependent oxidoreductase [Hankyongella ginsenosidimutans]|uniref:NAD(P)-dependent oxidoreductase n=1 Tax=Hankyongella ginsenosidimutans TaxID=1763828 RepID=A0A4D7C9U7_9SPHN|nr:NAD(P)-dependent oxidoreductase [Hankyongella ginsenosidimutans]